MKNPENPHPLNVIESGKEPSNASSRNLFIYFGEEGGRGDRKKNYQGHHPIGKLLRNKAREN